MIRKAQLGDLEQLKIIYNDAVLHTVATFDTETKDDVNRLAWFREHEVDPYVIFVEEREGKICGYASLSRYHERKAFDKTVEISVYVDAAYRGQGIGTELMKYTLEYAKNHPNIVTVISLITGENATSIHLHETLGFVYCGQQKCVGYKHGRWLDLNTYQIIYEGKLI
jgi:phosphinothricin acetyltransferase